MAHCVVPASQILAQQVSHAQELPHTDPSIPAVILHDVPTAAWSHCPLVRQTPEVQSVLSVHVWPFLSLHFFPMPVSVQAKFWWHWQ